MSIRPRAHKKRQMTQRAASAAVGLPLLMLAIWAGPPWFSLLAAAVAGVGALELCHLARRRGRRPAVLVAVVWAVGLVAVGHFVSAGLSASDEHKAVLGVAGVGALALAVALLWDLRAAPRLGDWGATAGAAVLTGGLLAYGPLLRGLDQGQQWLFLVVFVTFMADTTAFLVGRAIGRRPLAPQISPGKTWEGAVGGLLGAVGATVVLTQVLVLDTTMAAVLALGALMGVIGQLGDLAESWFKRAAGTKDSGWILPGHGGVLDRLDSIVFNLALVYYFVEWSTQ